MEKGQPPIKNRCSPTCMGHRLNPDDTLENLGFPNMFWWNILREARFPLAATTDDQPESGSLPWPSATSKGSYGGGPSRSQQCIRMHQDPEISWDAEVGINCVPGRIKQRQSCDLSLIKGARPLPHSWSAVQRFEPSGLSERWRSCSSIFCGISMGFPQVLSFLGPKDTASLFRALQSLAHLTQGSFRSVCLEQELVMSEVIACSRSGQHNNVPTRLSTWSVLYCLIVCLHVYIVVYIVVYMH